MSIWKMVAPGCKSQSLPFPVDICLGDFSGLLEHGVQKAQTPSATAQLGDTCSWEEQPMEGPRRR
jgi:hypothetical protein